MDFVNWVKETSLSSGQDDKKIPQLKKLKPELQLETVMNGVFKKFACNAEQILTKGRKKNKAREMAIHLAKDLGGMSCRDLGLYFGGVSGALITIMYNQVIKEVAKNRRIKRR